MSRLTRDEILDIKGYISIYSSKLLIIPANQVSFVISDKEIDWVYYYTMYQNDFCINAPSKFTNLLPSGSSQPPIPASNLPNTTSGNVATSNGFNWGQIYTGFDPGFDSEDTSPEFQKEIPAWLKITKCDCGVWTTYGKDYPADKHSDWCDIYKEEMKIQAINKVSSEDTPF